MATDIIGEPPADAPFFMDKEKTIINPAWLEWFTSIKTEVNDIDARVEALEP